MGGLSNVHRSKLFQCIRERFFILLTQHFKWHNKFTQLLVILFTYILFLIKFIQKLLHFFVVAKWRTFFFDPGNWVFNLYIQVSSNGLACVGISCLCETS